MKGFTLLGYELQPKLKLVVSSRKARQAIIESVEQTLVAGRREIRAALAVKKHAHKHCYAQTLVQMDRILYGWSHVLKELDTRVSGMLANFKGDVRRDMGCANTPSARRALGALPLTDTPAIQ